MIVYFDFVRKPLQLDRKIRMLKDWVKLKNSENCILSNITIYGKCMSNKVSL